MAKASVECIIAFPWTILQSIDYKRPQLSFIEARRNISYS